MSLSDILGHMDLSVFPQVALFIFATAFAAVVIRTTRRDRAELQEEARNLPLNEARRVETSGSL